MSVRRERGSNLRGQATVAAPVRIAGFGVHSGKPATVVILPAAADRGLVFVRSDVSPRVEIAARHDRVVASELCTVIGVAGVSIATIEHLMAALAGVGVDNALIEIDGPEMPIVDGGSESFVEAIEEAGLRRLETPRRLLRILRPVRVEAGDAYAEFVPFEGTRYDVTIDFATPLIGRQSFVLDLSPESFARDIARARTFGFVRDVERLREKGFALGSSLDNSVALGEDSILNPEGLHWPDEFVRHKTLDAVGDLALAGLGFRGMFRSYKSGHRMNTALVKALLADPSAFEVVHEQADRPLYAGAGLPLANAAVHSKA
jgi:UDP-3-O-[3-hydroxymyristoyl] N-acetylglucosamine deacetylase